MGSPVATCLWLSGHLWLAAVFCEGFALQFPLGLSLG